MRHLKAHALELEFRRHLQLPNETKFYVDIMNSAAFITPGVFGTRSAVKCGAPLSSRPVQFKSTFLNRKSYVQPDSRVVLRKRKLSQTQCSLEPLLLAEAPGIMAAITTTEVLLNVFNFAMVVRIILSWYPQTRLSEQPWIFVAVPTEPLLSAMRKVVKPVGGVDISPIVWFAIGSFLHEILVGQQGLLILVKKYF